MVSDFVPSCKLVPEIRNMYAFDKVVDLSKQCQVIEICAKSNSFSSPVSPVNVQVL